MTRSRLKITLAASAAAGVAVNLATAWLIFSAWQAGEPPAGLVVAWAVIACLGVACQSILRAGDHIRGRL